VDSGLACRGHPFEDLFEFPSLLPRYQRASRVLCLAVSTDERVYGGIGFPTPLRPFMQVRIACGP
jgi:hypothetical protein